MTGSPAKNDPLDKCTSPLGSGSSGLLKVPLILRCWINGLVFGFLPEVVLQASLKTACPVKAAR